MNVAEIISCIERIAPPAGAASWDNCGVQIVGLEEDVTRLAVTIDPSPEMVIAALEWGADMIITHHPLYMEPKALNEPGYFLDSTRAVMATGAWLYAAHTSLDVRPEGPAGWLHRAMKLSKLSVLAPNDPSEPEVGYGFWGQLPEPLPWKDFALRLGQHVNRDFWTLTGTTPETVSTVAYCTGSGGSLMNAAYAKGTDVYITGDLKYHQALESPQFTVDVGHFSLEDRMSAELADLLADELGNEGIKVRFLPGREPFKAHLPIRI
ncbi:Nif3-like dinuclear metal center hexameric protein [Desulfovibrio ferrophilus]|uniref:GTP cyclohydrolase 1 type 2 homolog n=1 Tax=Desulfovibrio ferrophilus TaxID=241368 RepID=A0A2Z6AXB0_9BACT|nr:Nif3-like dinuclear metal center hexameric protein [Desulfovibrio ferrophilus]BBD07833.1 putative GTP cyclohydrolase 1 type 2 [Desulfovibrio ferrophilus]